MKFNGNLIENNYSKTKQAIAWKKILFIFIFLLILLIVFFTLGYSLNNKIILTKETISIPNIDKSLNGYTILHISDLNGNTNIISEDAILKLLHGQRFNSVCFTGNMIGKNGNLSALTMLVEQIKKINEKAIIYFLPGEFDPDPISESPSQEIKSDYILILESLGVKYLDRPYYEQIGKRRVFFSPEYLYNIDPKTTLDTMTNEIENIENKGELFLPEKSSIYKNISYKSRIMEEAINVQKIIDPQDIQIIVSSMPLNSDTISNSISYSDPENMFSFRKAHMILSGSLVGGQWCLPGGQPIYVPEYGLLPDKQQISGKSRILTIDQYISTGLSCSPIYPYPKIRIYNPPTITLIKFNNKY